MGIITGIKRLGGLVALAAAFSATPFILAQDDAETVLEKGRMALDDRFYRLAESAFLNVLQQDDVPADRRVIAADSLLRSHWLQSNVDLLEKDLASFEATRLLDASAVACWRALLLDAKQDTPGALAILSRFESAPERRFPYAARALRLKAYLHLKSGQVPEASRTLGALTPSNALEGLYSRFDLGMVRLAEGNPVMAVNAWQPVMDAAHAPAALAADVRYWMAQAHLRTGAVAAAEALLKPLAQASDPDEYRRVRAGIALARARRMAGDADAGTALLTTLAEKVHLAVLRRNVEFELALHLLESQSPETAAEPVMRVVRTYAHDPEARRLLFRLGQAYLDANRAADAARVFKQALETFEDPDGSVSRGRALALAGMGRHVEAALVFEQAASVQGLHRADSLFRAGDHYFAAAQFGKALERYEQVLAVSSSTLVPPDLMDRARYQIGVTLAALGEEGRALETFKTLADADPGSLTTANALAGIGQLHLDAGRYAEAKAAFERVMNAYPGGDIYWRALHGRAMARYHQWEPDVLADFERIAAADDAAADMAQHARFMQVMCQYRLGRDAQALRMCRDFRSRYPESAWAPPAHFWIARFEYNTGNYAVAEQEFLSFAERYPEHELAPQSLFRAGRCAMRRQQYLLAIEQFGRLVKTYPQSRLIPDVRFHQAEAMVQLGQFAAAILVYEEVIHRESDPGLSAMAWGRKGDCQFTLGPDDPARYTEADASYRAVLKSPGLRLDHQLQAAYKLGLVQEKLERPEAALEWYYSQVMLPFLLERGKGTDPGDAARVWFSRAARGAADIAEGRKDWRQLVRILERAAEANVEFSQEARVRIQTVKSDYWWMFY